MAGTELPCDSDGKCMVCNVIPSDDAQIVFCTSCSSPWHIPCLHPSLHLLLLLQSSSTSASSSVDWFCPDCDSSSSSSSSSSSCSSSSSSSCSSTSSSSSSLGPRPLLPSNTKVCFHGKLEADLLTQIQAVRSDPHLSELEKARKCQDIMSRNIGTDMERGHEIQAKNMHKMLRIFDENMNCIFCMQLANRPVTTPCGHNFCLKCFQRWVAQGKKECGKCRTPIPPKMSSQPRINSALVAAIRMAKASSLPSTSGPSKPYYYIQNRDRPDKCFTTERAKKPGKSNVASGKIFVTVPPDHFGPIAAENDPVRGQGVLVGETWEDRMECRQWGAHLPHVAGIAGQSDYGAQSVALSGGYEDDEDHGEWFLYTGSGGRDLSGNKRTNGKQSFDQKFEKSNLSLKLSCNRGYPVRVVRSHKEKRSSYAPESGVRYDGIYRIEKCWRKKGIQGFKVCRYLFVRCDNEAAPWTSDQIGDRCRSLPEISELKDAVDLTGRNDKPAWDWKEEEGVWGWVTTPPTSRKSDDSTPGLKGGSRKSLTMGQRLLKEFGCGLCKKVLRLPLSTPCGHNFCKSCLVALFSGQNDIRERMVVGGRSLRAQKVLKRCPACQGDISDFLTNPQVNRQMEDVIQSLKEDESDIENNGSCKEEEIVLLPPDKEEIDTNVGNDDASVNGNGSALSSESGKVTYRALENCIASTKVEKDTAKEEFLNICARFPMYSEELLCSMLADQEGDVGELGCMLEALEKQEKRKIKQNVGAKQHVQSKNGCTDDALEEERSGEVEDDEKDGIQRSMSIRKPREDLDDSGKQAKRKKENL